MPRRGLALLALGCVLWAALAHAQTGDITAKAGRPGLVVAAPHGIVDAHTARIAEVIAERTGFGLVVATGFSFRRGTRSYRLDVNRPSESAIGGGEERASQEAARVYARYRERVEAIAGGPFVLYVEIHGNARLESAGHIEIATTGIDAETATKLRALLEAAQGAYARSLGLKVLIEPADPIYYRASAAKRHGILSLPQRVIHVELPRAARMDADAYGEILASFLTQALSLLVEPSLGATPRTFRMSPGLLSGHGVEMTLTWVEASCR